MEYQNKKEDSVLTLMLIWPSPIGQDVFEIKSCLSPCLSCFLLIGRNGNSLQKYSLQSLFFEVELTEIVV